MVRAPNDKFAKRIFQKYRLHPNGWALRQDQISQTLNGDVSDPTVTGGVEITSPAVLTAAVVGVPYTGALTATGGTGPYTWVIVSGGFLTGMSMDAAGAISGTPTVGGYASAVVKATDTLGAFSQKMIAIYSEVPVIDNSSLADGSVGSPYTETLTATGGVGPYTYGVAEGALPPGIELRFDGNIFGTPTFYGAFGFTVQVTDSFGVFNYSSFSIIIFP